MCFRRKAAGREFRQDAKILNHYQCLWLVKGGANGILADTSTTGAGNIYITSLGSGPIGIQGNGGHGIDARTLNGDISVNAVKGSVEFLFSKRRCFFPLRGTSDAERK